MLNVCVLTYECLGNLLRLVHWPGILLQHHGTICPKVENNSRWLHAGVSRLVIPPCLHRGHRGCEAAKLCANHHSSFGTPTCARVKQPQYCLTPEHRCQVPKQSGSPAQGVNPTIYKKACNGNGAAKRCPITITSALCWAMSLHQD